MRKANLYPMHSMLLRRNVARVISRSFKKFILFVYFERLSAVVPHLAEIHVAWI